MKRFLHALAALWPKRKEVGNPPAPPTSTGLRQHLAAVLRIEGYLSECTDIHSRKPNGLTSRQVERSVSTVNRPERSDVPTRATVGIDEPSRLTSDTHPARREVERSGSPNQPQSLPRIPQPMPLLTILMLVFFMCLMAAPSRAIGTAAFLDSIPESAIRPLKIGDTIPEELWHLPLQVVNHPEGKETITLNDYRGKLIILDFWGTFCGSCIAAMPKIAEVQKLFPEEMFVIPLSSSSPHATQDLLMNHKNLEPLKLFSVVGARIIKSYFPHGVVPHYVWINSEGQVVATTASNDVTKANIAQVLAGEEPYYAFKTYIDPLRPLLLNEENIPKGAALQYYSVFIRGPMVSLGGMVRLRRSEGTTHGMTIINHSIFSMYKTVAQHIMGGQLGKRFVTLDSTLDDTSCSFDFIVPVHQADSLYPKMLEMLNNVTGYNGQVVTRALSCLVLEAKTESRFISRQSEKYRQLYGDKYVLNKFPIGHLVSRLNGTDISGDILVLNETGYDGDIDITLYPPFNDLSHVRRQLAEYGLELNEAVRDVELFEVTKKLTKIHH